MASGALLTTFPPRNFTQKSFYQEELGVPYEIKKYERTPEQRAPPELLKVFPLGKSPIITDTGADGKENITLAESGAIVGPCAKQTHCSKTLHKS